MSIKLHEATKQFKIANKLAMFFLEKIDLPVKSHSSVINDEQLELLRRLSQDESEFAALKREFEQFENELKRKKSLKEEALPEQQDQVEEETAPPVETVEEKVKEKTEKTPEIAPERMPKSKKEVSGVIPKKAEPDSATREETSEPVKVQVIPQTEPPRKIQPRQPERKTPVPIPPKHVEPVVQADKLQESQPAAKPRKTEPEVKRRAEMESPSAVRKTYAPPRQQRGVKRSGKPGKSRALAKQAAQAAAEERRERNLAALELPESVHVPDFCTAKEMAEKLGIKFRDFEECLQKLNLLYQPNQFMGVEDIDSLCREIGVSIEIDKFEDYLFNSYISEYADVKVPRPPVVTVMGHVDHGKTTLLDTIRKTRVAEKEAGGITQRIGAYKVRVKDKEVVFVDTPGHEAFTNLRARGAKVTDLVILVVAANDGVQPQTIEAIHHARAAEVPIIVAINKIDLHGAAPDKVKMELSKHNLILEDWGGDVVSVEISAKMNQNIDSLLEMIHLVADLQELKAYAAIPARGTIIESRLDSQLGPMATVLIQHGVLRKGDHFVCGNSLGKVKSIFNDRGQPIPSAGIADPVEVMGFESVPEAGDLFQVVNDPEKSRKIVDLRRNQCREIKSKDVQAEKRVNLQNLFQMVEQKKVQSFSVLIKADTFGSAEVLEALLAKKNRDNFKIEVNYKGVGNITEGDVLLASTTNAIILGFNVKAPQKILALAKREQVEVKLYNVIYHLIEEIELAINGAIEPEYRDVLVGKVEVLQVFKIAKSGNVAGCIVREGRVSNKAKIKVIRGGDLVFEGNLETLKRVKDEVSEVRAGTECGIKIKNFNDIEVGDFLEVYETSKVV